jgi:hypothetical protein
VSCAAAIVLALGFAVIRARTAVPEARTGATETALLALEGSVQVVHRADEVVAPLRARMAVGSADEVVTGEDGRARASLSSGAEVDIGSQTKVRFRGNKDGRQGSSASTTPSTGAQEAVLLATGRVTVRVPKLGPARSLAVETSEATVVVHGTTFSVERHVTLEDGPRTSVDVTEGSVAVLHRGVELLLRAGDHWSSSSRPALDSDDDSEPRSASLEAAPIKLRSAGRGAVSRGSSAKVASDAPLSEKRSSLAAENSLLQAAMAARQKGDARRAADLAAELVARYPASPLAEEARVERMRALVGTGDPRAAEADARAYLADYPRGFARQEAGRIVTGASR